MRFESLTVENFGALHGREFQLGRRHVVVHGANERGKSSFLGALRTVLMGFTPASGSKHPYAWTGDGGVPAPLALRARLGPGGAEKGSVLVERRLDPSPWLRITGSGEPSAEAKGARANDPLPWLDHLSPSLFDGVHCITPADPRDLEAGVRDEIDRLVLGEDAVASQLTGRALLAALDAERKTLWRRDRRSKKNRVAEIDARMAELSAEARAARAVDRGLLDLERELEERHAQVDRLQTARRSAAERVAALQLLERIARAVAAESSADGIELDALGGLEEVPPGHLLAELEDAEESLEEPAERLARPRAEFEDQDERILGLAGEIEGIARDEVEIDHLRRRALEAEDRAEAAERAARAEERAVFAAEPGRLDVDELRELEREAEVWRIEAEDARLSGRASGSAVLPIAVVGGAVLGAGLTVVGDFRVGAACAAAAPVLTLAIDRAMGRSRGGTPMPAGLRERMETAGMDAAFARRPEDMALALAAMRRAAGERDAFADAHAAAARARGEITRIEEAWLDLSDTAGVAVETARTAPGALRSALEHARARRVAASADAAERQRAKVEAERARARIALVTGRVEALRASLAAAVPGEPSLERAYVRATAALRSRERLEGVLAELRTDRSWPRAKADPTSTDALRHGVPPDAALEAALAAEREAADAIAEHTERIARIRERLERERPPRTASEVDSELAVLREARTEAFDAHDRLALARALVEEGERRHRSLHQPKILARASAWLSSITAGRYAELGRDLENGELWVREGSSGRTLGVGPPLSRGVLEQAHMALRLGTIEHLDGEHEPAPLLLDEALVHWDEARRRELYRVMAGLNGGRQVLIFTCHPHLADEAAGALDALRIDL